jgi:hypothetical protein
MFQFPILLFNKKETQQNWGTGTQVFIQSLPVMLLQPSQSVEPSLILVANY